MLFNSVEYLLFLPLVFIIFWSLAKNLKAQNFFILASSYFFYGYWDYRFLSLIVLSSITDYILGILISESTSNKKSQLYLSLSLIINLGLLFTFKYFNFFIDSFAELVTSFGMQPNVSSLNIILPVGISFYTFQTLSYTIDIYRGNLQPSKNIINFFAYVSFFPQLVAGPIERASNLLPQFDTKKVFDYYKAKDGLRQILWGLFKKVVIADNCAILVNKIFPNFEEAGSLILILGVVLFAIQIYCDFSGYSDIAIGTAKLLGFDLMQNFATPYFARDIAEFWRRWHISLSTWFRDYLYIPLGGSRVGKNKALRNIFVIFVVSGFWHGANWTFIVWGFLHALYYLPQFLLGSNRNYIDNVGEGKKLGSIKELSQVLITFSLVCFAWIFFRADNISHAWGYILNILSNWTNLLAVPFYYDVNILPKLSVFISLLIIVEWFNRDQKHGLQKLFKNIVLRYSFYIVLCLCVLQYLYGESSFIYFQF